MSGPVQKYARVQVLLHWAIALLLVVSFFSHEAMKASWRALRQGSEGFVPDAGTLVHVWVGVTIGVLMVLRVIVRLAKGAPPPVEGNPILNKVASVVHGLLYLVLLAIPASGMAAWFGGISDAGEVHELLFNVALGLVVLHVVAALFHQFILRDNLLARMR